MCSDAALSAVLLLLRKGRRRNIAPALTPGEWSMMKIYALDVHVYYRQITVHSIVLLAY